MKLVPTIDLLRVHVACRNSATLLNNYNFDLIGAGAVVLDVCEVGGAGGVCSQQNVPGNISNISSSPLIPKPPLSRAGLF